MATLFESVQAVAQTGRVIMLLAIIALVAWGLASLSLKVLGVAIAAIGLAMIIWFPGRPEHQRVLFRDTAIKISAAILIIGLLLIVFG